MSWILLSAAILLQPSHQVPPAEAPSPRDWHYAARTDRPDWISLDAIYRGEVTAELREELLAGLAVPGRSAASTACHEIRLPWSSDVTLEARLAESGFVGLGRVISITPGFYYDFPGSMVEVRFTEVFAGPRNPHVRYIFVAGGRFPLENGGSLCVTAVGGPPVPEQGDEVIVAVRSQFEGDRVVLENSPHALFGLGKHAAATEGVQASSHFTELAGVSAAEFKSAVRSALLRRKQ